MVHHFVAFLAILSVCSGFSSRLPARMQRRSAPALRMGLEFFTHYEEITVSTDHGMSIKDITPQVEAIVAKSGCKEGTVTVLSKHSTVSVTINEMEGRLVDDIRQVPIPFFASSPRRISLC
jgi:hypothetical protein